MPTSEIDNNVKKNNPQSTGRNKRAALPKYGLALLKHLCTEYRLIVAGRNLDKKELTWQDAIIADKENRLLRKICG